MKLEFPAIVMTHWTVFRVQWYFITMQSDEDVAKQMMKTVSGNKKLVHFP